MDLYRQNLLTLTTLDPELAAAVDRTAPAPHVTVAPSRSGAPSAEYALADGSKVTLHSRYDPLDEADGFARAADTDKVTTYIVLGFGLGHHVKALLGAMRKGSRIIVIEHDMGLFRAAMGAVDLREVFLSRRVSIFVGKSTPELFTALNPHVVRIFLDAVYLVHRPSAQAAPDYYRAVHEALTDYIDYGMQNVITTVSIDLMSKTNTLMNLPWYASSPGIARFRDAFKGRPAVIVSAGPSLHRNIDILPRAAGKAVVIAVSTVFKPLLRRGIKPDFAVILDYHPISKKYFEDADGDEDVILVADPKASWEAVEAHAGPKAVVHNDALHRTIGSPDFHKGLLPAGTTVAHSAFFFAEYMGADPIIFVGQDLAHPDGVTHVPGTAVHDIWAVEANRFSSIEMKEWETILRMQKNLRRITDVHGNEIYTDGQMFSYLQQFEVNFYNSAATVIDATEGGAAKKYTTPMTLADALDKYAATPLGDFPDASHLEEADRTDAGGRADIDRALAGWLSRMGEVHAFYERTLAILEEIEKYWPDQERIAPLLAEVDGIRSEVEGYTDVNSLVRESAQAAELLKIKADRAIASKRLEGLEEQKARLERDVNYVSGLRDAVEGLEGSFERALERFRTFDFSGRVESPDRQGAAL